MTFGNCITKYQGGEAGGEHGRSTQKNRRETRICHSDGSPEFPEGGGLALYIRLNTGGG